jgi:hypothetical protein
MKEKVMFQKRDAQMLEAFRNLITYFSAVANMYEERFQEMATCWREHRQELLSELDKENEDEGKQTEFDYVDQFYSAIWDLYEFFKGKPNILQNVFENALPYLADVETLRKRNLERIAKLKEKQNQK